LAGELRFRWQPQDAALRGLRPAVRMKHGGESLQSVHQARARPAEESVAVGDVYAPAAHGGNRTGRAFTGDSSGDWLYEALHRFGFASQPGSRSADDGLTLTDCYITAAARCAPPGNTPTRQEFDNCRPYLERELRLLPTVRVVLALGRIGHEAWLRASGWWTRLPARRRPRFGHGLVARMPDGMRLVCTYHPSRQNTNTGKLTRRMWYGVFRRVKGLIDG